MTSIDNKLQDLICKIDRNNEARKDAETCINGKLAEIQAELELIILNEEVVNGFANARKHSDPKQQKEGFKQEEAEKKMSEIAEVLTKLTELSTKFDNAEKHRDAQLKNTQDLWLQELKHTREMFALELSAQQKIVSAAMDAGDKVATQRSESAEKVAILAIGGQTPIKVMILTAAGLMLTAVGMLFIFVNTSATTTRSELGAFKVEVAQKFDKLDGKLDQLISRKR